MYVIFVIVRTPFYTCVSINCPTENGGTFSSVVCVPAVVAAVVVPASGGGQMYMSSSKELERYIFEESTISRIG